MKPDISKGVEIIRNLVEQAKTTTELPNGSVQSLTTMRNMKTLKSYDNQYNQPTVSIFDEPSTISQLPPNHKLSPLDIASTSITHPPRVIQRIIQPHNPPVVSSELDKPTSTTKRPTKPSTTTRTTTSTTARTTTMRTTTKGHNLPKPQTDLSIGINDIADLLNKIPSTTTIRVKTTTTTKRPRTTTHSQDDDLLFLRQLVSEI